MPHLFRRSAHLTVAVMALLIVLISTVARDIFWQQMERSVEETMQAAHIEARLGDAFSLMQAAETGQRGYLLTGQPSYLEPYERAVRELPEHFARLEAMLRVRPDADYVFSEWKAAAAEQLALMGQSIRIYQTEGQPAAIAFVSRERDKATMDRIHRMVGSIRELMTADYIRSNKTRHERMRTVVWWTTTAGICGVIAGLVALFMYAQARRLADEESSQERRAALAEGVAKQKSTFLASMSHEIRTPMNAVLGFTEVMESEPLTEKQQACLSSIKQAGNALLQLINDILDLSKVEAGMIALHPEPADIREICEFVRTVIGQTCAKKGLELRIEIPRSIPQALLLDEGRMRQILVNLAGNAARFTESGSITLSAEVAYHPEDRAHLTLTLQVKDTGIGIALDRQAEIFDAFVQADSRRSAEKQGTGLGLSIVKRLTQLMGGTVRVESAPGRGSTFTVVIPDVEISAPLHGRSHPAGEAPIELDDFEASEILIVDDSPVNRDLLAFIFEGTRHHLRFAANGQEALDLMAREKPALVLMDVRMPVMTGTEAVDRMRAIRGLKDVPVIAVTASSLRHEEGNLRERFDGYLRKPFSRAELYRETGRFLTRAKERPGSAPPEISPDSPAPQAHAAAWHEAVRRLRQMEVSTWAALQNTLAITEVRNFAWRLQLLAESADCPPLRTYAETLHTHAANFAADDLEAHLAAFPQLISQLETCTS